LQGSWWRGTSKDKTKCLFNSRKNNIPEDLSQQGGKGEKEGIFGGKEGNPDGGGGRKKKVGKKKIEITHVRTDCHSVARQRFAIKQGTATII